MVNNFASNQTVSSVDVRWQSHTGGAAVVDRSWAPFLPRIRSAQILLRSRP